MLINFKEASSILFKNLRYTEQQSMFVLGLNYRAEEGNGEIDFGLNVSKYKSDLPFSISSQEQKIHLVWDGTTDIRTVYFDQKQILELVPIPGLRLVNYTDFSAKRFWNGRSEDISAVLEQAARDGLLSIYYEPQNKFVTQIPTSDSTKVPIIKHQYGADYIKNSQSFYLLYQILMIERHYMNKTLDECIKELYG